MQRSALTAPIVWAFVIYAVASAVHVVLLAVGSPLAGPTKLVLMLLLALPVLFSVPAIVQRSALFLILAALLARRRRRRVLPRVA